MTEEPKSLRDLPEAPIKKKKRRLTRSTGSGASTCPGCGKFASLDTEDPEVEYLDIEEDGMVSVQIRIARTSACCGEEMKYAIFDEQIEPSSELSDHIEMEEESGREYALSVEEGSIELTERQDTVDKKTGKPLKYMFRKSYIGFSLTAHISCDCGYEETVELSDDLQASGFEVA